MNRDLHWIRRTQIPDFAARLCDLLESRLPLAVPSDGAEDDWNLVGAAILAASARHLRAIAHLKATFPSAVIGWQLVRSLFEYVVTYGWIAADRGVHTKRWLKYDYAYRLRLDDDLRAFGDGVLDDGNRDRLAAYEPDLDPMRSVAERAREADARWGERFDELGLPEDLGRFVRLYPLIYRNGSRFTHPSSHVVQAFVHGDSPALTVGDEQPAERDLALIGSALLAAALAVACDAGQSLGLTLDEIRGALSA